MKEELRSKYKEIRKNIQNKEKKSKIIMEKIINLKEYLNASTIAVYNSTKDEVSTKKLIEYSLKIGKTVALPRVFNNTLKFYKIDKQEQYELSILNIYEPLDNIQKNIEKNKIDLIIVPGICFDIYGNRIGYGKGFYDHFLTRDMYSIGICFKEQITKEIKPEKFDIPVRKIITD